MLKSNSGLFWIFSLAFVMQVVGAGLVVWDVARSNRLAEMFASTAQKMTSAYESLTSKDEFDEYLTEKVEKSQEGRRERQGDEVVLGTKIEMQIIAPFEYLRLTSNYLQQMAGLSVTYENEKNKVPAWLEWLGPVTLVLGIVLGFIGTMLSIR